MLKEIILEALKLTIMIVSFRASKIISFGMVHSSFRV